MSYWKLLSRVGGFAVGAAAILAVVAGFGASWEEVLDAFWPDIAVALLVLLVIVLTVGLLLDHRAMPTVEVTGPRADDQARADEILWILSRESMDKIERADFAGGWPEWMTVPLNVMLDKYSAHEHHFVDPEVEPLRQKLEQTAETFIGVEAMNGWPSRWHDQARDIGWSASEVEGIPEREKLAQQRVHLLSTARNDFVDAFDALVARLKLKDYDLGALSRGRTHPEIKRRDHPY